MPVVASAIANPIQRPATETVVSFCTGDNGIVVMAALRLTAIDAVRMVVPISSSIGLLSLYLELHLVIVATPRPRRRGPVARKRQRARSGTSAPTRSESATTAASAPPPSLPRRE